jgi:hypothetical protein
MLAGSDLLSHKASRTQGQLLEQGGVMKSICVPPLQVVGFQPEHMTNLPVAAMTNLSERVFSASTHHLQWSSQMRVCVPVCVCVCVCVSDNVARQDDLNCAFFGEHILHFCHVSMS